MSIAITCDCGARFDPEPAMPGTSIPCPECGQTITIPDQVASPASVSVYALASFTLAIIGAFTLIGTILAVGLGCYALLRLRKQPDRVSGLIYAQLGIGLGVFFTVLTVGIMFYRISLPLAGWLRQRTLAGQLESITTPVSSSDKLCLLDAPSTGWYRVRGNRGADPVVDDQLNKRDVVLIPLTHRAYIDIATDTVNTPPELMHYEYHLAMELHPDRRLFQDANGIVPWQDRPPPPVPTETHALPELNGYKGHEWLFDVRLGDQPWRYLIRIYRDSRPGKRTAPPVYVIRGYAPLREFQAVEKDIRQAFTSIRFSK